MELGTPLDKPRRRWPWWARWGAYLGIVLVVIVTLAVVTLNALIGAAEERLAAEVAKIEAAGESLDPADYAPPEVPEDENAAPLYVEAKRILDRDGTGLDLTALHAIVVEARRLTPDEIATLGEAVESLDAVWPLLEEAARRSACRFSSDYSAGLMTEVGEQKGMRALAVWSAVRTRWLAEIGDVEQVSAMLHTQFRMGRHMEGQPTLIEHLVRISMCGIGLDSLERTVDGPDADELAAVLDGMARTDLHTGLASGYRMERACGFDIYGVMMEKPEMLFGADEELGAFMRTPLIGRLFVTGSRARTLQFMVLEIEEAEHEPWEMARGRAAAEFERVFGAGRRPWTPIVHYDYILPGIVVGAIGKGTLLTDLKEARRRAACCALALRIHRLREGGDPEDPAAYCRETLGEDLVRDPYTGNDLLFDLGPDRILVYSLGPNGIDDGGVHDETDPDEGPDIPFTIEALIEAPTGEEGE